MPTITVVRVKNAITGGISSLFETTNEFVQQEVNEDTLLDQIRNGANLTPNENLFFYGDYVWKTFFESRFDEFISYGEDHAAELDQLDI